MTSIVILCAVQFFSQEPIPLILEEIYKKSYSCEQFVPLQKDLVVQKLENVNRYFPAQRPSWPIIVNSLDTKNVVDIKKWIKNGIRPGFLLPENHLEDPHLFDQLKKLREMGAIPIATLKERKKSKLEAKRYYWCMHGVCPAGWYLPDGINETVKFLPKGLYISASHWYKKPNLPIPDRMIEFCDKNILPWNQIKVLFNTEEIRKDPFVSHYFTPKINESWKWLGIEFYYTQGQLHTNFIGKIILGVGEFSFWIWDRIHLIKINFFSWINENFSWLAVAIALLNIIMLIGSIIRKKGIEK